MLDKVIQIAKEAGEVAREGFRKNMIVETKGSLTNLVTEYDKKSKKQLSILYEKNFQVIRFLQRRAVYRKNRPSIFG
jgi:fructose-1,6-bisphosphatase/inositol monophosphatase family enzyme